MQSRAEEDRRRHAPYQWHYGSRPLQDAYRKAMCPEHRHRHKACRGALLPLPSLGVSFSVAWPGHGKDRWILASFSETSTRLSCVWQFNSATPIRGAFHSAAGRIPMSTTPHTCAAKGSITRCRCSEQSDRREIEFPSSMFHQVGFAPLFSPQVAKLDQNFKWTNPRATWQIDRLLSNGQEQRECTLMC